MILAGKIAFLMLFVCYSVPVVLAGARGQKVYGLQTFLWGSGLVGFVTLQWLL